MPYLSCFSYENYSYNTKSVLNKMENKEYEICNKVLLCIGGLNQSMKEYADTNKWVKNYKTVLLFRIKPGMDYDINNVCNKLYPELVEYDDIDGVGFSFGASILQKLSSMKQFQTLTLIAPSGKYNNTYFEYILKNICEFLYTINQTSFWKVVSMYPTYGLDDFDTNNIKCNKLILYTSFDDVIHPYDGTHFKSSCFKHNINDGGHFGAFQMWQSDCQEYKIQERNPYSWLLKPYFWPHNIFNLCVGIYTFNIHYFHYIFLATFSWTFLEYVFHRFLQHFFMRKAHWKHYKYPTKEKFTRLPCLLPKLYELIIIRYLLCYRLLEFTPDQTNMFMVGIFISFFCFETAHSMSHKRLDNTSYFYNIKDYHHYHHSYPTTNFGFTSRR